MPARTLTLLAILFAVVVPICAETYVVDGENGADSNDGISAPFATLAKGAAAVGPGDTLRIGPMSAPYPEMLRLSRHGLPGAPIVIEGGGATLIGSDPAPTEGWTEQGGIYQHPLRSHDRMMVFGDERHFMKGASPTNLQPEQWRWADGTFYFRPEEGKHPNDYGMRFAVDRASGVITTGAGLIVVRDLTCMNFWNDGFNLHGGTGPMLFENITGIWNGDEGFSAHENAECYVWGGDFSNNYWHGINDIIYSRTHFVDIVCRDNLSKGVRFNGGIHSLTDCEVSGSPINVELLQASSKTFPMAAQHPLDRSFTNLRNMVVRSADDETGVFVGPNSEAVIEHCLLEGGSTVVDVQAGGKAFVVNSVVMGGIAREVASAGEYVGDHNLYFPGRFLTAGTMYDAESFAEWRAQTSNDANSIIAEPVLDETRSRLAPSSPGVLGADSGAYGGIAIGPENRLAQASGAAGTVPVLDVEGEATEGGGMRITYDFETENPWSRIYPEPVQSQDGVALETSAELSDEQAHGGEKSSRLHVVTPPGAPARYNIKLFSQYLPFSRPVQKLSFWRYGDGSGRRAHVRIRDNRGEGFYDAPFAIDWEGWQQVTWDLNERPPASISAGDRNQEQDGPTMELVVELHQAPGSEMTLFFDDLQVELAPEGWTTPKPTGAPATPATPAAPAAEPDTVMQGQVEGQTMSFDFETENVWGRTFPEPAEIGGAAVPATSELSDEQAHSGTKSAKVMMTVPAGAPDALSLKLFTEDVATTGPATAWSVWIYSDAPRSFAMRIRDVRGESFYGPSVKHDGGGWQEIAWNLDEQPARNSGGNNDNVQDTPLEFVLTTSINKDEGPLVYYVDDLSVTVAEAGQAAAPEPQPQAPAADRPASFCEIVLPDPAAPAPDPVTSTLPAGGTGLAWDFEQAHPWNRIYPVPEANAAGVAIGGVAELTQEEAHGGTASGKVTVFAPPGRFTVKLFSAKLQMAQAPVKRVAFWLNTGGKPLSFKIRVRDASGEGFYSPPMKVEGAGWQRVEWDLAATPPANISGGDGNQTQNAPPVEIVMEYGVSGDGWTEHTIFIDDLEVDLAG